jgi:CheY-like chemotaxis protein
VAVESIAQALVRAREHTPDLLISDYRLRGPDTGAAAIASLRALLGKEVPAILITGDTAPQRLREAQVSGIPLLHKPVLPSHLYGKVVEVLGQSEPRRAEDAQTEGCAKTLKTKLERRAGATG